MKAEFMVIEDTPQEEDVRQSESPSSIFNKIMRVKTYAKIDDPFLHARLLDFDQPGQVASEVTRQPFSECNRVITGQMASCNLKCPYCYVPDKYKTIEISHGDYPADFFAFNHILPQDQKAGVLRYSGGEPMLQQEWLARSVCLAIGYRHTPYIWVDTNLTIQPDNATLSALTRRKVGVAGCFKPGIHGVDIAQQLNIIVRYVEAGVNLFLYYPSWGGDREAITNVLRMLKEIHRNLPLRLHVIHINWDYAAVQSDANYLNETEFRRKLLRQFLISNYKPHEIWMPSHQATLGKLI